MRTFFVSFSLCFSTSRLSEIIRAEGRELTETRNHLNAVLVSSNRAEVLVWTNMNCNEFIDYCPINVFWKDFSFVFLCFLFCARCASTNSSCYWWRRSINIFSLQMQCGKAYFIRLRDRASIMRIWIEGKARALETHLFLPTWNLHMWTSQKRISPFAQTQKNKLNHWVSFSP